MTAETSVPRHEVSPLAMVAFTAGLFVAFGFLQASPVEVWRGLERILLARDTLITDYIGLGGIGAAFVNAGVLTLAVCAVYWRTRAPVTGASVACLFLVLGFGLFGKNFLNVWIIPAGVFLYARFRGETFGQHINVAFFGAALAPVFSEILFSTTLPLSVALPLGVATGLGIGFILVPVAAQLFQAHQGHTLYNMGFTAGLVGTLVVAIYKSYGFVPEPVLIWTSGNNARLGPLLVGVFATMIATGWRTDRDPLPGLRRLVSLSGQSPCDFIARCGLGVTLINMGVTGLMGLAYVLLIGADLNGPVIGAILSIVGFAAFGKHPLNIAPVMAGVVLGALTKGVSLTAPGILLAALFSTTLAPIAGRFGWHWGVLAGFVHLSVAQTVGQLHGGLNLYNNGFAAGIVAAVLSPVILAVQARRSGRPQKSDDEIV